MDRFLIKATFGSEALIRGQRGAYLRPDAFRRKCGKAGFAIDIIAIGEV